MGTTSYILIQSAARNARGLVSSLCLRRAHPSWEHLRCTPSLGCRDGSLAASLADWKSTVHLAKGHENSHGFTWMSEGFRIWAYEAIGCTTDNVAEGTLRFLRYKLNSFGQEVLKLQILNTMYSLANHHIALTATIYFALLSLLAPISTHPLKPSSSSQAYLSSSRPSLLPVSPSSPPSPGVDPSASPHGTSTCSRP